MQLIKPMKQIIKTIYWIKFVLLTLILGAVILAFLGFYKILVIQSGSMTPIINTGSVILVKPEKTYQTGDVITLDTGNKRYLTHRIYNIEDDSLTTKGDFNNDIDSKTFSLSSIYGKVFLTIPLLGYFFIFVKTLPGLIIFIIIPGLIIICLEIIKLLKK